MDDRIETRVVDTAAAAKTEVVQQNAAEIFWISLSVETDGTKGSAKIYDGFDAEGKLRWQNEPAREHHALFIPPIPCDQGICVVTDNKIACYTIGYRSSKWVEGKE